MQHLLDPALERYTHDHSTPPSDLLAELVTETRAASPRFNMQVGSVEGALLRILVGLVGAKRVLEVGTFTGYSALCMAEGLPDDGKLITCDVDPEMTKLARAFFDRSPHGKKIEIRLGDALDTIKALPESEPFDLVFLDADKARYLDYYELALPRLRKGGLVVADNTLWSGAVLDPRTPDDIGIHTFNGRVTSDPRVDNALLSVRDGIMIARKL